MWYPCWDVVLSMAEVNAGPSCTPLSWSRKWSTECRGWYLLTVPFRDQVQMASGVNLKRGVTEGSDCKAIWANNLVLVEVAPNYNYNNSPRVLYFHHFVFFFFLNSVSSHWYLSVFRYPAAVWELSLLLLMGNKQKWAEASWDLFYRAAYCPLQFLLNAIPLHSLSLYYSWRKM